MPKDPKLLSSRQWEDELEITQERLEYVISRQEEKRRWGKERSISAELLSVVALSHVHWRHQSEPQELADDFHELLQEAFTYQAWKVGHAWKAKTLEVKRRLSKTLHALVQDAPVGPSFRREPTYRLFEVIRSMDEAERCKSAVSTAVLRLQDAKDAEQGRVAADTMLECLREVEFRAVM